MTISERLFQIMREKNISMPELSRMTGISRHTIFDWQRRKTNPGADKIMILCEALQIIPRDLLVGNENSEQVTKANTEMISQPAKKRSENHDYPSGSFEAQLLRSCANLSEKNKKRLVAYISMLENMKE